MSAKQIQISFNEEEVEVLQALFIKEIANRASLGGSEHSQWSTQVDSVLRKIEESCNDLIRNINEKNNEKGVIYGRFK